jgi:hypothetical protein
MKTKHMKHITKIIATVAFMGGFFSCSDPELPEPNLGNTTTGFSANFIFVNASPDAPALSFFINNTKVGTDAGSDANYAQAAYTPISLTSSGLAGTVTANTNIRAKAASGAIGGVLASTDLTYRAGNNNINNFVAINGNSYSVFAIDSINRPAPLRTLNSGNFGDITYYNPLNGRQLSVVERASLSDPEKANLVTIGVVPLGSSDPGGPRFYVVQDAFPVITTPATQAGIRFVNAVANANNTPGGPSLYARLRPTAGATMVLVNGSTHVANSSSLNPSVGSRTVTTTPPAVAAANFTALPIATAGVPINYTLEVSTVSTYATIAYNAPISFAPGKNYTVFVRGLVGKTGSKKISHGIITHN